MIKFAQILRDWWPRYVAAAAADPIPARHWRAVEAVLTCRTPRRGGHLHRCERCQLNYYLYHSCNHRSCPACGAREQQLWAHRRQAAILPVPYFLLTFTVPESMRAYFLRYPRELYPILFAAAKEAVGTLCRMPKHLGGEPGYIAVLHTWTRRLFLHPHLHLLIPAVGLASDGISLKHPREPEFFLPVKALSALFREAFRICLQERFPDLARTIPGSVWNEAWVTHSQQAGTGRCALRYLAAYVKKSAFSEERLLSYDNDGRVLLRWRESGSRRWKVEELSALELIRRWLLHVLPRGLIRMRYYGWMAAAAKRSFLRIRFLLGMHPWQAAIDPEAEPICCARCHGPLTFLGRIEPVRGPPISREICL